MTVPSQCDRLLAVLADGGWHSVPEIHWLIGPCRLNSRAAELRARGVQIVCERTPGVSGPGAYAYRIEGSAGCCDTATGLLSGGDVSHHRMREGVLSAEQPPPLADPLPGGSSQLVLEVAA